ncbi:restriction endonuclease subunit S [Saccharicrinis aurantiacus]|uniref:restriction endonuclease subunit S n=1 Tax=Saccharicrinis aurantiacus TaxID=1849719 RepID=UPI0024907849|nr:restriction endonuclease subunit S [Saccharicrinis aurantiacus]
MENKLVPVLRFPEFDGEWAEKKLGKITSYVDYRGRAPEKSIKGVFLVTAKNIRKGFIDYEISKEYVPLDNYNIVMSKGTPKKGDVLFTTEAPLGNVCQVDNEDIALAQRVIKLRGNDCINNNYLLHYMLCPIYQKLINRMAFGTTVLGISGKALRNTVIVFPTLHEQTRIASFLTAVDKRINLLQKKKAQLEQYKKGIMQKIFSQAIRFNDEDGKLFPNWEEKKLGEVGTFYYGKSAPKHSLSETAETPCVRYGELYTKYNGIIDKIYSYTEIPKSNLKFSKGGEILIPRVGEAPMDFCKCSWLPIKDVAIGEMISVYNTDQHQPYVVAYIRAKLKHQFARVVEGGNVSNLYFRYLEKVAINLPSIPEQQKIASFLSSIDKQIDNVGMQIKASQQWKKGLLQKMFV